MQASAAGVLHVLGVDLIDDPGQVSLDVGGRLEGGHGRFRAELEDLDGLVEVDGGRLRERDGDARVRFALRGCRCLGEGTRRLDLGHLRDELLDLVEVLIVEVVVCTETVGELVVPDEAVEAALDELSGP